MHTLDANADSAHVRQQLDRILKSASFTGAARLQELLAYTVEEVLAGRGPELKETVIGAEVFERSGHDPRLDSIVRVTISKLRGKLREYYLTEGLNDAVEIEFPRGAYAPILRWRTPAQFAEKTAEEPILQAPVEPPPRRIPLFAWWILAVSVVVGCVALVVRTTGRPRQLELIRFQIAPPESTPLRSFPIGRVLVSPDGRKLAAMATQAQNSKIVIRAFESVTPWLLPAPPRPTLLAWSPDSSSIVYYSEGRLWRIDIVGGSPLEIGEAQGVRSAAWGNSGQIVFANGGTGGLFEMPLKGGKASRLTEPDISAGEVQHAHPQFLPGGGDLLYTAVHADESQSTIYLLPLRNHSARVALVQAHSNAGFLALPDGRSYLLYVRAGALIAHPFDLRRRRLSGEPFVLEQKVSYYPFHAMADFSASNDVLIFRNNNVTQERRLAVLDRTGKTLAEHAVPGVVRYPRISPDGRSVVVERLKLDSSAGNLWVAPIENLDAANRLTLDAAGSYGPVWSPDSQSVFYGTRRLQGPGLFRKSLRDGAELQLTQMPGTPTNCSPDGQWVLFNHEDAKTSRDIWLARADGRSPPTIFRQTRHDELEAQFSADGQWVTYESDESGTREIFVERFLPHAAERTRTRVARGHSPLWTKGGREIIFHRDGYLFFVERLPGEGLKFSQERPLFRTAPYFHRGFGYDASPTGDKFVFSVPSQSGPSPSSEIGVLLWK